MVGWCPSTCCTATYDHRQTHPPIGRPAARCLSAAAACPAATAGLLGGGAAPDVSVVLLLLVVLCRHHQCAGSVMVFVWDSASKTTTLVEEYAPGTTEMITGPVAGGVSQAVRTVLAG